MQVEITQQDLNNWPDQNPLMLALTRAFPGKYVSCDGREILIFENNQFPTYSWLEDFQSETYTDYMTQRSITVWKRIEKPHPKLLHRILLDKKSQNILQANANKERKIKEAKKVLAETNLDPFTIDLPVNRMMQRS